jgi:hypothetical protein
MKYLDLLPSVIDQVLFRQQMLRDRQKMLGAIRASEERYRLLFDSNPIPSMVYDLQTSSSWRSMKPPSPLRLYARGVPFRDQRHLYSEEMPVTEHTSKLTGE